MTDEIYCFDKLFSENTMYYLQVVNNRPLTNIYHSHDFYEIIVFVNGTATHCINGKTFHAEKGQMFCLNPNDFHSFINTSSDICIVSFSIKPREYESIAAIFCFSQKNNFEIKLYNCLDKINKIYKNSLSCMITNDTNDYKLLLCNLVRLMTNTKSEEKNDNLSETLKLMQKPDNIRDGINAMIRISGYSRSHLYRLVKERMGITLNEYIKELRLKAAYQYILLTDDSFEQIGENIGYKSFSHFNKIFYRKYGITPSKLRNTRNVHTI